MESLTGSWTGEFDAFEGRSALQGVVTRAGAASAAVGLIEACLGMEIDIAAFGGEGVRE